MQKLDLLFLSFVSLFLFQCTSSDGVSWVFDPQEDVYALVVEQVDVDPRNVHLSIINLVNGKVNELKKEKISHSGTTALGTFQAIDLANGRYFMERNLRLLTIDLETGTTIFDQYMGQKLGLQFNDRTQKLYAIIRENSATNPTLLEINPENGDTSHVGHFPPASFYGLYQDINSADDMYLAYDYYQKKLHTMNLLTGEASVVPVSSIKGLQVNPNDSKIYGLDELSDESGFKLVTIDPVSGQKSEVSTSRLPFKSINKEGIQTFHKESNSYVVWGWDFDGAIRLFSIDVSTGEVVNDPKVERHLWGIQN